MVKLNKKRSYSYAVYFFVDYIVEYGYQICLLFVGSYLIFYKNQNFTKGQLASFLATAGSFVSNMAMVVSSYNDFMESCAGAEGLFKIMNHQCDIILHCHDCNTKKKLISNEQIQGEIKFSNVSFFYPSDQNKKKVLSNVSFTIKPGQNIGIVGKSGCGKSTIASLLLRLYDPVEGEILIDGQNMKQYNLNDLHHSIGYVQQESPLFTGTIEDNILYGVPEEISEQKQQAKNDLISVTTQANAWEFIKEKAEKFQYNVGQKGKNVSGGQKQRIVISRALMKKPKILIFDEATSALDSQSQLIIQNSISNLKKNSNITMIIVTHSYKIVEDCDQILVMQKGEIIQQGTHAALLKQIGLYKTLVETLEHDNQDN